MGQSRCLYSAVKRFLFILSLILFPSPIFASFEQQVGQLFIVGAYSNQLDASKEGLDDHPTQYVEEMIERYHVGGVLFKMRWNPEQLKSLAAHYQSLSQTPLFICLDAEWGLGQRMVEGDRFPKNYALGQLSNLKDIYRTGLEIGRQCRAIGINVNFAPVVDINTNPLNPIINHRSFGSDPERVADCGVEMMRGLQEGGVLACAKHFPGHGDTIVDSHTGLPKVDHSLRRLHDVELIPFKRLIDRRVDMVMGAHLLMPAVDTLYPTSLSNPAITGLLKDEMGFEGLTITDDLIMGAVVNHYSLERAVVLAFLAGNDLILLSRDVEKGIKAIMDSIEKGEISRKEVIRRVEKITAVKQQLAERKDLKPDPSLIGELYSELVQIVRGPFHQQPVDAFIQVGGSGDSEFFLFDLNGAYCSKAPTEKEVRFHINTMKEHDHVAVIIFDMQPTVRTEFGVSKEERLLVQQLIEQGNKVTVILMGDPHAKSLFSDEARVIGAYDDSREAQKASLSIIQEGR